jgi:hypothetical protein
MMRIMQIIKKSVRCLNFGKSQKRQKEKLILSGGLFSRKIGGNGKNGRLRIPV